MDKTEFHPGSAIFALVAQCKQAAREENKKINHPFPIKNNFQQISCTMNWQQCCYCELKASGSMSLRTSP